MKTQVVSGAVFKELVALVRQAAGKCRACHGTGKAYVDLTDVIPLDEIWILNGASPVDCPYCARHRAVLAKLGVDVPVLWNEADSNGRFPRRRGS